MSDIGSGIVGSFNQATLASRRAEEEKTRARRTEEDRVREARQRFIAAQEEVAQAQTLHGTRVEPDKEESAGREARDQYESHEELERRRRQITPARTPPPRQRSPEEETRPAAGDSGHLIDLEA